ncbi:hypothetical protein ACHAQH_009497 [Verticillium albo-atrum]
MGSIKAPLNIVLGGAANQIGDKSLDPTAKYETPEEINTFLDTFLERGYTQLDTARLYSPNAPGTSERLLGAVNAGEKITIDTKVLSGPPGLHTKEKILADLEESLTALKIKQINIYYLHIPDRETPFHEACEAMDEAYRVGKFKKWGLSNYTGAEVRDFLDICEARGLVKPSVYQGHYNPIVRGGETELFSVLREAGMSFYAYSPGGGGFFAGNHKNVQKGGRFDTSLFIGGVFSSLYVKPNIMAATNKAIEVAAIYGIVGHAMALRWTVHHSILSREHGDSVIVGASSVKQLVTNLDMIEDGPLPDDVVKSLEELQGEIGRAIAYHQ